MKAFTTSDQVRPFLGWLIIDGGLTPVNQPLDKTVNRVFKGHLRDCYDQWSLTAPINPQTGAPFPPTRQQCAQWVVTAWDKIPEELCQKAWVHCGYKPKSNLGNGTEIVRYTDAQTSLMMQKIIGDDSYIGIDDAEITEPINPLEFDKYGDAVRDQVE